MCSLKESYQQNSSMKKHSRAMSQRYWPDERQLLGRQADLLWPLAIFQWPRADLVFFLVSEYPPSDRLVPDHLL